MPRPGPAGLTAMQLAVILGIAMAIAAVAFAFQNNVPVTVTFLLWRFDGSLAMLLLAASGIGALVVALVSTPSAIRSRWQLLRQRKEIAAKDAAIADLQAKLGIRERAEEQTRTGGWRPLP